MGRVDNLGGAADVGLRVARLRGERGLTYRELEEATASAGNRVSASTLWRIENGDPPPKVSVDDLVTLCRVFDVTPDDMLTSADEIDRREAKRLSDEMVRAFEECLRAAQRIFEIGAELSTLVTSERGLDIFDASLFQFAPNVEHIHPYVRDEFGGLLSEIGDAGTRYKDRHANRAGREQQIRERLDYLNAKLERDLHAWQASPFVPQRDHTTDAELDELRDDLATYPERMKQFAAWEADHPLKVNGVEL
jgi:transcriptional regulator with XRE-family HTH domain